MREEEILRIDSNKVYAVYENWFRFARKAIRDIDLKIPKPSMLVLAGMGGSGTTADIIYDILYHQKIPLYVVKGYNLPPCIDPNALVITISSSGNTEETLSIFNEAYSKGLNIIGISSGGLLEEACKKYNYMHLKIEEHLAPRYSLPDLLFTALNLLSHIESLEFIRDHIYNALKVMEEIRDKISIESSENISKELAYALKKRIAVSYTSPYCKSIGTRFKNSLNENAKSLSLTADIIEASHNEIVAWSREKSFIPLLIRDPRDSNNIRKRFKIFYDILESYNHKVYQLPIFSDEPLANIIASIYVLDYATIYLSVLKGIDPFPIEPINRLKKLLKGCKDESKKDKGR